MEAIKLKTIEDLLLCPEERVELLGGEIVRRPMTRAHHARAQRRSAGALDAFDRPSRPRGWWILTEASVAYESAGD
jgi:hypothetical protein